jgi:hypothetical protein
MPTTIVLKSDLTVQKLNALRAPFEKDEALINRLADACAANFKEAQAQAPAQTNQMSQSAHFSQRTLREELLDAFVALGPKVESGQVRKWLENKLSPLLNGADREVLSAGSPRWWNNVKFARSKLADQGLILRPCPDGIWELTEYGLTVVENRHRTDH